MMDRPRLTLIPMLMLAVVIGSDVPVRLRHWLYLAVGILMMAYGTWLLATSRKGNGK